ncbi:MAG: hypothetical protein AUI83_05025 [Armatimonadetes bacterium 13_1_40CM_3_65_7]|nr:MAG: hypothetical protein AUI83_05025 [Armatimonadetes bacterium 13_1_40CM_3_65_7]
MGQQRIVHAIFDGFLFDGVKVDRLQQEVDTGAGAGNDLPVARDETDPPFNGPVEVGGRRNVLCLDQLAENRATSAISVWKTWRSGCAASSELHERDVAENEVGGQQTGDIPSHPRYARRAARIRP